MSNFNAYNSFNSDFNKYNKTFYQKPQFNQNPRSIDKNLNFQNTNSENFEKTKDINKVNKFIFENSDFADKNKFIFDSNIFSFLF